MRGSSYRSAFSICIVPLLVGTTALGGCATTGHNKPADTQQSKVEEAVSENKENVIGAAILGVLGAGIGYALAGEKGAAIGGATGVAAGAGLGQLFKNKDKKRTESVSEAGYRPEADDRDAVANLDSDVENREVASGIEASEAIAVAHVQSDVSTFNAPTSERELSGRAITYDIVKDGDVVGSLSVRPRGYATESSGITRSLLLCETDSSESCAKLDLRLRQD
jgi:hypothetical protein